MDKTSMVWLPYTQDAVSASLAGLVEVIIHDDRLQSTTGCSDSRRKRTGKGTTKRIRTVEGSCWPCKKRRIKCDLNKPSCSRCSMVGATCNYDTRLLKWSVRPAGTAPSSYQAISREEQLAASLAVYEKRALDYFHGRFWPLMGNSSKLCAPPTFVALEHRVVLLATCVLAESHRYLQDGRNSQRNLYLKRVDCLAAVREELDFCCADENGPLLILLFAVLLLYFTDGYLECTRDFASTNSHHAGVMAIIERLGGVASVMDSGSDSLHMLLSHFASTDLTTAMLRGTTPAFPPQFWESVEYGPVWWGKDPFGKSSVPAVFKEMSTMMFWRENLLNRSETPPIDQIRIFEASLRPLYVQFRPLDCQDAEIMDGTYDPEDPDMAACYTFTRALQHTALIFLYRAVCNLPTSHQLVQQHVMACIDCISGVERPSQVLNCAVFPLCIAGAHVISTKHQRTVLEILNVIYIDMRFASVQSIRSALEAVWEREADGLPWVEMFSGLENTLVL